jgi:hypothetical protein
MRFLVTDRPAAATGCLVAASFQCSVATLHGHVSMPIDASASGSAATSGFETQGVETQGVGFDTASIEAALRAACRVLTARPENEPTIARFVSMMGAVAVGSVGKPGTAPPAFIDTGRATSQRELDALAKSARSLADRIDGLHQSTILSLADVGILGAWRHDLPTELRRIARQADAADVSHLPRKARPGRLRDNRSLVVARIAGRVYRDLTGHRPTYTTDPATSARRGRWPTFLCSVFQAMRLDDYSDHIMRTVAAEMKRAADGTGDAKSPNSGN